MNKTALTTIRAELESFACVNERCDSYGQKGQNNRTVRKIYGKDGIRYLRCHCCGKEFSERKAMALWNTKVSAEKAIVMAEHLAEGCSLKPTPRMVNFNARALR